VNSSQACQVRLLGTPSVAAFDGSPIGRRVVQRHRVALLALLSLSPGHGLSRERLLGYLWPENEPERARQLLNQAVYQLRKGLGEDAIESAGDELRLNVERVGVDVVEFEAAVASARHSQAVALYRGPLLDGFYLSEAVEFERWLESERARLAGGFAKALESLAEAAEETRDFSASAEWWMKRAAHDPFDSRVALLVMQALEKAGNRAGALQHGSTHERLLHDEFGIAPPPDVISFAERLRHEAAQAPARVLPLRANAEPRARKPAPRESPISRTSTPPALSDSGGESVKATVSPPLAKTFRHWKVFGVLAAAGAGALVFWFANRAKDRAWLRDDAIPRIEHYLDVADWEHAYRLAREADARVPGSREIAELWPRLTWLVRMTSEPAGATVFRQPYTGDTSAWEVLGRTPLEQIRIPYGLSRIRLELDGYRPVLRALGGAHINWRELKPGNPDHLLVGPEVYRLDKPRELPADMVRVPGGTLTSGDDSLRFADFLMSRFEVTNAEFKRFVDAGGYRRPDLWPPIVVGGDTIGWQQAMMRFTDRTGRPGPSTWEAGDYPASEGEFPVSGVSWYEAAAYARFAGRELPTAEHWQQGLANSLFPWLLPASNFGGRGPRAVTQSRAMSHVEVFDLTGNVREWTATAIGSEFIILGGSWTDPYYIAGTPDVSARPEDRSAGNGIRLVITRDDAPTAARMRARVPIRTTAPTVASRTPSPDLVYAAYSRAFSYDNSELEPVVERVDTTRLWIRERITIDAGYAGGRLPLHLYRPTASKPPFQTVVYWPGWDTFWLADADEYFVKQMDFVIKSGRAVAFPIFSGTFERRTSNKVRTPAFGTAEYRDNTIHTIKELRRTVDYIRTRPDLDSAAIAFYGYSWGGVNGPIALAQEGRFRTAIINIGLLPPMAATPEVDPVNSLPRVRIPTLMFSGEFDLMVPRENATRYFDLIGTPDARKRHVWAIGGHFVPRALVIRETLDWLDRYLGPTSR
jgi:DNA-binding SARP family transcriptional activator/dienelactone hydrolase